MEARLLLGFIIFKLVLQISSTDAWNGPEFTIRMDELLYIFNFDFPPTIYAFYTHTKFSAFYNNLDTYFTPILLHPLVLLLLK